MGDIHTAFCDLLLCPRIYWKSHRETKQVKTFDVPCQLAQRQNYARSSFVLSIRRLRILRQSKAPPPINDVPLLMLISKQTQLTASHRQMNTAVTRDSLHKCARRTPALGGMRQRTVLTLGGGIQCFTTLLYVWDYVSQCVSFDQRGTHVGFLKFFAF